LQLASRYGSRISQQELVSIAEAAAHQMNLRVDRDARRRKIVMIKWFEENWPMIFPVLNWIVLDTQRSAET
jgi:hypothetical protein